MIYDYNCGTFGNSKFFDEIVDDIIFDSKKISESDRRAIAEVVETQTRDGGTTRIKLHDKKGALDSLARHLGLFVEHHEVTGANGGPIQVAEMSPQERKDRIKYLLTVINEPDDKSTEPK